MVRGKISWIQLQTNWMAVICSIYSIKMRIRPDPYHYRICTQLRKYGIIHDRPWINFMRFMRILIIKQWATKIEAIWFCINSGLVTDFNRQMKSDDRTAERKAIFSSNACGSIPKWYMYFILTMMRTVRRLKMDCWMGGALWFQWGSGKQTNADFDMVCYYLLDKFADPIPDWLTMAAT